MSRQREFDAETALDQALHLFWSRGYDGVSLSDLTSVTRVARPGLYAVFGNKQALFCKALDRYLTVHLAFARQALQDPCLRTAIERLFQGLVELLSDPRTPAGCLLVNGAIASSTRADPVRQELILRRRLLERSLDQRIRKAIEEGQLSGQANPAALSGQLMAVAFGLAVLAKDGADRGHLRSIADNTLAMLPLLAD